MEKKKISPRIEEPCHDFLSKHFNTLNAGAEYVLDGFPMLYNRSLFELKGTFSKAELCFLVEAIRDTRLSSQLAGQQLKIYCEDAIRFRQLDRKWKIEGNGLTLKIAELSAFQVACLEIWAQKYWLKKWKVGKFGISEYVSFLCA